MAEKIRFNLPGGSTITVDRKDYESLSDSQKKEFIQTQVQKANKDLTAKNKSPDSLLDQARTGAAEGLAATVQLPAWLAQGAGALANASADIRKARADAYRGREVDPADLKIDVPDSLYDAQTPIMEAVAEHTGPLAGPPTDPLSSLVRGGTSALGSMTPVSIGGKLAKKGAGKIPEWLASITSPSALVAETTAGAFGQLGADSAREAGQGPLVQLLAGLGGGVAGAAGVGIPRTLTGAAISPLTRGITPAGQRKTAAETFVDALAGSEKGKASRREVVDRAIAKLDQGRVTPLSVAERTESPGVMAIQRDLQARAPNPELTPVGEVHSQVRGKTQDNIRGLGGLEGDIEPGRQSIARLANELELGNEEYTAAQKFVADLDASTNVSRSDLGEVISKQVRSNLAAIKKRESQAYNALYDHPDAQSIPTDPLKTVWGKLTNDQKEKLAAAYSSLVPYDSRRLLGGKPEAGDADAEDIDDLISRVFGGDAVDDIGEEVADEFYTGRSGKGTLEPGKFGESESLKEVHGFSSRMKKLGRETANSDPAQSRIAYMLADAADAAIADVDSLAPLYDRAKEITRDRVLTFQEGAAGKLTKRDKQAELVTHPAKAAYDTIGAGRPIDKVIAANELVAAGVSDESIKAFFKRDFVDAGEFSEDGIKVDALKKWISKHSEVLKVDPILKKQLDGIVTGSIKADKAIQLVKEGSKRLQGVADANDFRMLDTLLTSPNPRTLARTIMGRGDETAKKGLKAAVSHRVISDAFGGKEPKLTALNPKDIESNNKNLYDIMEDTLGKDGLRRLQRIHDELELSVKGQASGSKTGTVVKRENKILAILGSMFGLSVAPFSSGGGQMAQANLVSRTIRNTLRKLGVGQAQQIMVDALGNEELFRALLTPLTTEARQSKVLDKLTPWIIGATIPQVTEKEDR